MHSGRILWMLPAPDQPSSQDAHVAVADPDDAQHPEDGPSSASMSASQQSPHVQPTAGALSASEGRQPQSLADAVPATEGDEEAVQKDWQVQPMLLDVQKECFSRLLLLPEILTDHLPDTYLAAVQQL